MALPLGYPFAPLERRFGGEASSPSIHLFYVGAGDVMLFGEFVYVMESVGEILGEVTAGEVYCPSVCGLLHWRCNALEGSD